MQDTLDFIHGKISQIRNKMLNQHIQSYNFIYISKLFDIDNNDKILLYFKESKQLIINYYEETSQKFSNKYFFIGFKNMILAIQQANLSILQLLFSNSLDINICFLSGSKDIFDQFIHINYKEIDFDSIFQEEIQNFNSKFKPIEIKGSYLQILKCILPCISGYLIKYGYSKLQKDRFFNDADETKAVEKIEEEDYIFLRIIGLGSIFKTELIYHIERCELFALKRINITDNETEKLIRREIENYAKIKHPLMPKFYGTVKSHNYLIMEYINGKTLKNIKDIHLTNDEKIKIIFELMIVLEFLHRNHFIYRDLKPNNVMIDENKTVVLIDFDRMINSDNLINNNGNGNQNISNNFGSIFISPEVNSEKVSYKCDIYSLGKMIYFIMNEKNPNQDMHDMASNCKEFNEIEYFYNRMTNENPNERPTICDAILEFYIMYNQKLRANRIFEDYFGQLYGKKTIEKLINFEIKEISDAFFLLGEIYLDGEIVPKDINKSIHYYTLAANKNNKKTLYKLAKLYKEGEHVQQDMKESLHYYELAANQNDSNALQDLGFLYFQGEFVPKDIEKAIHYFTLAANQNNPKSLYNLGVIYLSDKYNKKDVNKAIQYYTLSSDLDYADAQYNLGFLYEKGMYIDQDIDKAIHFYSLASDKKHAEAQCNLGTIYFEGQYVSQDINKAIYYYSLAAENNDEDAQLNLGLIYDEGMYVKRDINKAIYYYSLAADKNNANAQYNLAILYYPNDIDKSIHYYKLAGSQGFADAYYNLALIYDDGYYATQDNDKKIYYYKLAADLDHPISQYNLGVFYSQKHLISKHINDVIHYYTLAAKNGIDQAQFNLAVIYDEGIYTIRDIEKAIHYYSLAADQNNACAQYNLGLIYDEGHYVSKNVNKAMHYYSLAADQNHPKALYNLGSIYYEGEYVKEDKLKALHYFIRGAKENDSDSQFNLGVIYSEGKFVQKDMNKSIYYFSQAAFQNDKARIVLGIILYEGEFIQKNINKSLNLFRQASKNENFHSHFILGYLYHIGTDVKKDTEKAIYYYKMATSYNFECAKNNLAIFYKNKLDGEKSKNISYSIELLKEAIDQKQDILSMYNLAHLYLFQSPIKNSVDEAIKLLAFSCAELEIALGLLCLALILKFDFDIAKIENELFNNGCYYKNQSNTILKTIKEKNLLDSSIFRRVFNFYQKFDIIYNHRFCYDLLVQQHNQENPNQCNSENITADFYEGFGIDLNN